MAYNYRYSPLGSYPGASLSGFGGLSGSALSNSYTGLYDSTYGSTRTSPYTSRSGSISSLSSIGSGSNHGNSIGTGSNTIGSHGTGNNLTNTWGSTRSLGRYSRPSSYAGYSKSTPSLEVDYKKLYEDEKLGNERLFRELEQCKKELGDAKKELDRIMKRNEQTRITADTNDRREKRALERKLSEMEEELKKVDALKLDNQRLKDENGALIRVISKLSK